MKHPRLDIDQLLIFLLLAVTVSQLAAYLSRFTGVVLAYLQAGAIDLAIWRCAFWYRKYSGRKQRRLALFGLVVFSLVSAWYNRNYYAMRDPALPSWQSWLMGAILPAGVALLSYLYGQKSESRFGDGQESHHLATSDDAPIRLPSFACKAPGCQFVAASQNGLNAHARAHGNGHERIEAAVKEAHNG